MLSCNTLVELWAPTRPTHVHWSPKSASVRTPGHFTELVHIFTQTKDCVLSWYDLWWGCKSFGYRNRQGSIRCVVTYYRLRRGGHIPECENGTIKAHWGDEVVREMPIPQRAPVQIHFETPSPCINPPQRLPTCVIAAFKRVKLSCLSVSEMRKGVIQLADSHFTWVVNLTHTSIRITTIQLMHHIQIYRHMRMRFGRLFIL